MLQPHDNLNVGRFTLSACAMAIVAMSLLVTPTWTNANESADAKNAGHMQDGMSMTGDADYDFATNMRMHHQMGVDMAKTELKNGKDAEMRRMAEDIITAQQKEIAALDQWLKARKKP
ncbi:DUF305 domain-containing protein [Pseudomonas sp. F(2018)]|uniref:DUF305 domain-containing protein n=1 Tax=Pseudomonas TaxID=286 RepID=UPI0021159092|nr:DUF305 domain-containing protein [Pseudomonas sp. F(2018)]